MKRTFTTNLNINCECGLPCVGWVDVTLDDEGVDVQVNHVIEELPDDPYADLPSELTAQLGGTWKEMGLITPMEIESQVTLTAKVEDITPTSVSTTYYGMGDNQLLFGESQINDEVK